MHIDNVIFLILSKNAYTKFSEGPAKPMKTDAPHCHYGGEELFCAYENSRFGFYTATTVLHRKGALFNFAYTLAPYQHDYFRCRTEIDTM